MQLQAICANVKAQAHGYVVTLSMQVSFAQLDKYLASFPGRNPGNQARL